MVVVYPNQVAILNVLSNGLREHAIRQFIGLPGFVIEGDLTRMVVEQRPKNRICQASAEDLRRGVTILPT